MPAPAGLGIRTQGLSSFAAAHLQAECSKRSLRLREDANLFVRPLRFAESAVAALVSPRNNYAAFDVGGSPRLQKSRAGDSPRGAGFKMRGVPAGLIVETFRKTCSSTRARSQDDRTLGSKLDNPRPYSKKQGSRICFEPPESVLDEVKLGEALNTGRDHDDERARIVGTKRDFLQRRSPSPLKWKGVDRTLRFRQFPCDLALETAQKRVAAHQCPSPRARDSDNPVLFQRPTPSQSASGVSIRTSSTGPQSLPGSPQVFHRMICSPSGSSTESACIPTASVGAMGSSAPSPAVSSREVGTNSNIPNYHRTCLPRTVVPTESRNRSPPRRDSCQGPSKLPMKGVLREGRTRTRSKNCSSTEVAIATPTNPPLTPTSASAISFPTTSPVSTVLTSPKKMPSRTDASPPQSTRGDPSPRAPRADVEVGVQKRMKWTSIADTVARLGELRGKLERSFQVAEDGFTAEFDSLEKRLHLHRRGLHAYAACDPASIRKNVESGESRTV